MSIYTDHMLYIFTILEDEENKLVLGSDDYPWAPEMQLVLDALDALADEQSAIPPAPAEQEASQPCH